MRTGTVRTLVVTMLFACACASRTPSQTGCLQRTAAPWNTVGATLTRYANCERGVQLCRDQTITQSSGYFVVWQGSCSNTFDIAAQDAILASAQQYVSSPTCPATGKPMTIGSWEYTNDLIVGGGSSCVVRVQIHYECCGGANPK